MDGIGRWIGLQDFDTPLGRCEVAHARNSAVS
jgi:hypothetical protein